MFFSRKRKSAARPGGLSHVAWDNETVKAIAGSDRFNVIVSSVTRTVTSGKMSDNGFEHSTPVSFEVHGFIRYPKFIVVQFSFTNGNGAGVFSYDSMDRVDGSDQDVKVPILRVALFDQKIATEFYEAHRCALLSGRRHTFVRVWKRTGDGLMPELDKEHGYSYQSRYEVLGVTTWCELEASTLPDWARSLTHENFSIRDLPASSYQMRLG